MNSIIIFEDGSWEWEELSTIKVQNSGLKNICVKIGSHWHDTEVSRMVKDYYYEGDISWTFDDHNL